MAGRGRPERLRGAAPQELVTAQICDPVLGIPARVRLRELDMRYERRMARMVGGVTAVLICTGGWAGTAIPPIVNSVSPNPVIVWGSPQTLTINGSGFLSGSAL